MLNFFTKARAISLHGLLIIITSCYLLFVIGISEFDILATIIGSTFLCLITTLLVLLVVNHTIIKDKISVAIKTNKKNIFSLEKTSLNLKLKNANIFPFFELKINPYFKDTKEELPSQIFRTSKNEDSINFSHNFPHRGNWRLDKFRVQLRDRLNLVSTYIDVPIYTESIIVKPVRTKNKNLPPICSTYKQGDILPSQDKPKGDYYDLKKYHPSDGMKKIIWKIFARRGELVSRHQEKSATPEGKVLIYGLINKNDEVIASHCLKYIKELEEMNLTPIFSCLGSSDSVTGYTESLNLCLKSVWKSNNYKNSLIKNSISNLLAQTQGSSIKEVAIFAGNHNQKLNQITKTLKSKNITPIIFVHKGVGEKTSNIKNLFIKTKRKFQDKNKSINRNQGKVIHV